MPQGYGSGGSGVPGHRSVWTSADVHIFYLTATALYYAIDWGRRVQVSSNADPATVINAAITYVNGTLGGGQIRILEGTYAIVDSINMADNVLLSGEGVGTFFDGDGLANNEHLIILSGDTDCGIRDMQMQTADGGGNTIHCIFIEDGSNAFHIENITIIDSDSDGIHIEGTNILGGWIQNCGILDTDDVGISISMDAANYADYLHINNNVVTSAGLEGLSLIDVRYSEISGNDIDQNTQDGIELNLTTDCLVVDNFVYLNTQHGISLVDADRNIIEDNICHTNDSGDAATYDGINVDGDSTENLVEGNYCYLNKRYGIMTSGLRTSILGNYIWGNDRHGIYEDVTDCLINDNFCYDNGQDAAGTYHAIYVGGARTEVVGNFCTDPGDSTEDGIHLADGASDCQISNNYCYYGMGDGIELVANNDRCLIEGNYCHTNDDHGIISTATTSSLLTIQNNYVYANGLDGIEVNGPECSINDNFVYNNSQTQAGNNHGIYLGNTAADRCQINDNWVGDDGTNQEDGIHLVDGASDCLISGNFIYDHMGDGIFLAQTNIDSSVLNNFVSSNDDSGIFVGAAGVRTAVNNNHCLINGLYGIHIEASECQINNNYIYANGQEAADTYHGIYLGAADADNNQICDNYIGDDGTNVEDGIHLVDGVINCLIDGNYIRNLRGDGIDLVANNDDCQIKNNYLTLNDDYGVRIRAATCDANVVQNNRFVGNVTGAISDGGTDTALEEVFMEVNDPDASLGPHPVILLPDTVNTNLRIQWLAPKEFQELVRVRGVYVCDSTGNMDYWDYGQFGKKCLEPWDMHYASTDETTHAFSYSGSFECVNHVGALTGIAAGDLAGIRIGRGGANAADTINDDCYFLGLEVEYV